MISFLLLLIELGVIGAIAAGVYYMPHIEAAIPGGELYTIMVIIALGFLELFLFYYHLKRIADRRDPRTDLSYTVGDGEGSFFWGFIIGFIFNILGVIILAFTKKSDTKRGSLVGLVVLFGLVVFTALTYSILYS